MTKPRYRQRELLAMKVESPDQTVSGALGRPASGRRLGEGLSIIPSQILGTIPPVLDGFEPQLSHEMAHPGRAAPPSSKGTRQIFL